jgi:hypothetical protein
MRPPHNGKRVILTSLLFAGAENTDIILDSKGKIGFHQVGRLDMGTNSFVYNQAYLSQNVTQDFDSNLYIADFASSP